jgi:pimeloyl-ACP methyl ester carboxylesterase
MPTTKWSRAVTFAASVAAAAGAVLAPAPTALAQPQVPAGLAEFYAQRPAWAPCAPEGELAQLQCTELSVPLDYKKPDADRISVTISKLPAKDPAKRRGVLVLNPGGPGGEGVPLPLQLGDRPIAQSYDLIGFDPRGVGRSTPLRCEVAPSLGGNTSRPTDADIHLLAAQAQQDNTACERSAGGLRPHINTPNTARDMDVIRGALGETKLNYLGFSYGTYLGAVFGSMFPQSMDRSVLDSSVHPDWIWREQFKEQAVAIRADVDKAFAWIAQRNGTYGLGSSHDEVLANSEAVAAKLAGRAVRLPEYGTVGRTEYDGLVGGGSRYRPVWETLAEVMRTARDLANGTPPADARRAADAGRAAKVLGDIEIPKTYSGVFDTVTCEAQWPQDVKVYENDVRLYRDLYPYAYGALRAAPTPCTFTDFPREDPVTDLRRDYPIGLVVQAEGDTQTHYDGGPAMAAKLDEPLVSVADDGTHGLYVSNACVQRIVDRYLVQGVLPGTRTTCAGDPRPAVPADGAPATRSAPRSSLTDQVTEFVQRKRLAELPF